MSNELKTTVRLWVLQPLKLTCRLEFRENYGNIFRPILSFANYFIFSFDYKEKKRKLFINSGLEPATFSGSSIVP
jgi:hypothetical protein